VRARRDPERGAAAVEFAMCIPALVMVVFGGVLLLRALNVRSHVVDAVNGGARAGAVAAARNGAVDEGSVRHNNKQRLTGVSGCQQPLAVVVTPSGDVPYRKITVTATCTLNLPAAPILGGLGLNQVVATAVMPLDVELQR
jgi:Flp pilus assembly protein TadG